MNIKAVRPWDREAAATPGSKPEGRTYTFDAEQALYSAYAPVPIQTTWSPDSRP